jgi:hypothetical protein
MVLEHLQHRNSKPPPLFRSPGKKEEISTNHSHELTLSHLVPKDHGTTKYAVYLSSFLNKSLQNIKGLKQRPSCLSDLPRTRSSGPPKASTFFFSVLQTFKKFENAKVRWNILIRCRVALDMSRMEQSTDLASLF